MGFRKKNAKTKGNRKAEASVVLGKPASQLTKEDKKILAARLAEIRHENGGNATVQNTLPFLCMLKTMLGRLPFVSSIIERNEKRIQVIREEKIPKREQKIEQGWKKIDSLTDKRDRISHKLNRVVALNDTIRSFSIGFNKERREAFSDAMSRLNIASVECLNVRYP